MLIGKMNFKEELMKESIRCIKNRNHKRFIYIYNTYDDIMKDNDRIIKACIDEVDDMLMEMFVADHMISDVNKYLIYSIKTDKSCIFDIIYRDTDDMLFDYKTLIDTCIECGFVCPLETIYWRQIDKSLKLINYIIKKCTSSNNEWMIKYIVIVLNPNFYAIYLSVKYLTEEKKYKTIRNLLLSERPNYDYFMISAIKIADKKTFDIIYNIADHNKIDKVECIKKVSNIIISMHSNFSFLNRIIVKRN